MRAKCLMAVAVCIVLQSAVARAVEHTDDSLKTVRKNLDDGKAVLIDVREKGEWNRGHLKEALHVALSQLRDASGDDDAPAEISVKLSKKKIIYCHCAGGFRALPAGEILKKWGFDDLVEAGFPQAK